MFLNLSRSIYRYATLAAIALLSFGGKPAPVLAQVEEVPRDRAPTLIPRPLPPSEQPLPERTPAPPPEIPLEPIAPPPEEEVPAEAAELTVPVQQFVVEDSTVFDADDLAKLAWRVALLPDDEELEPDSEGEDIVRRTTNEVHKFAAYYCPDDLLDELLAESLAEPINDFTAEPESSEREAEEERVEAQIDDWAAEIESLESQVGVELTAELTFEQLLRARSAITQLYVTCGYITSGAILPPNQTPAVEEGIVRIRVVEGRLEDEGIIVNVEGRNRLNESYIRSRLNLAASEPLNRRDLLQGLQLLQLDPLIRRISAELQTGTRPATNILQVTVDEADSFTATLTANNYRSPSVGSFERGISVNQANLLGFGDGFNFAYNNTDGSNGIETNYTIPLSPRDDTLRLAYGYTESEVVEDPFDVLGIEATSRYYELSLRHPLSRTPTEEWALGFTFTRQESQTELSIDDLGPTPLSPGADDEGRTEISALRFTQEWINRSNRQVLAARSQFSLGVDWLDATTNDDGAPDSRFLAWRGQGQWARLLDDRGTLLLLRGDVQLTGDALVPLEQFGLGGPTSVRGYRQDALLTDNGALATAELRYRLPIIRSDDQQDGVFVVPFFDLGKGWNVESKDPDPSALVGVGVGLLWQQDELFHDGDSIYARLDWGIPLVSDDSRDRTWQESGIYFSIEYSPF
jgi:hemolysin activation/secretion protein